MAGWVQRHAGRRFAGDGPNLYGYTDSVGKPLVETNLYGYTLQDPLNFIDPYGLTAECPKTPPSTNDKDWTSYKGNPNVFHCGFKGVIENRTPSPEDPQAECFYDDENNLVDDYHPYADCQGTPNQYPSSDWWNHTWNDSGGIWEKGLSGFCASEFYRHDQNAD